MGDDGNDIIKCTCWLDQDDGVIIPWSDCEIHGRQVIDGPDSLEPKMHP